jgi:lipopolysaccharide export system permease protein
MKILERYVLQAFLSAFALAWLILSFVMTIGLLVRITQLMIEGLPPRAVGLFMLVGFPETLRLTLPLALLVSALLVFSRLSADNEISAMRACGVNLLAIMRWPLVTGALCTLIGLYINNEIVPRSHEVRRNLRSVISVDVGLDLLESGRFITDFPKMTLWFARKEGNWIQDLIVFDHSQEGLTREVRADKALVTTNGTDIVLEMYKVRIDPIEVDRPGVASADRFRHVIPEAMKRRRYVRKEKDFHFNELRQAIRKVRANEKGLSRKAMQRLLSIYRTEYRMRYVYAFASLCFVMIGVPLGIRTHRKESTIGMAVSLVVSMAYYLCVILLQSLDKYPALRPDILLWLPVGVCLTLATWLISKNL